MLHVAFYFSYWVHYYSCVQLFALNRMCFYFTKRLQNISIVLWLLVRTAESFLNLKQTTRYFSNFFLNEYNGLIYCFDSFVLFYASNFWNLTKNSWNKNKRGHFKKKKFFQNLSHFVRISVSSWIIVNLLLKFFLAFFYV